jgi:hypothetical protein
VMELPLAGGADPTNAGAEPTIADAAQVRGGGCLRCRPSSRNGRAVGMRRRIVRRAARACKQ